MNKGKLVDIIRNLPTPYPVYVYLNNGYYYTESMDEEYRQLCSEEQNFCEALVDAYF